MSEVIEVLQSLTAAVDINTPEVENSTSLFDKACRAEQVQCLQELPTTDPTSDRDDILTTNGDIVPNTCDWITTKDAFVTWKQSDSGLLWVRGRPGKGKTYFAVYLAKFLGDLSSRPIIIYYFCDYPDVMKRGNAESTLRSLIYQLVQSREDLLHLLWPWRVRKRDIFGESSIEILWTVFESMVQELKDRDIYCIDGLNECEEHCHEKLLRKLEGLFNHYTEAQNNHRMKLMLMIKPFPDVLSRALLSSPCLDLDHNTGSATALKRYISVRAAELPSLKPINTNHKLLRHFTSVFLEKSQGSFLWVNLMIEGLKPNSVNDIETALENLPVGLDQVYDRMLSKIPSDNSDTILKILQWVSLAMRPLTLHEISEAVGIQSTGNLSVQDICAGYVQSCRHLLAMAGYHPNQTVSFPHQSAKEYILKQQTHPDYKIIDTEGHATILDRLLSCLEEEPLSSQDGNKDTIQQSALSEYATDFWIHHMRLLDKPHTLKIYHKHRFFFDNNPILKSQWLTLIQNLLKPSNTKKLPLLHFACAFGLHYLAAHSLNLYNKTFHARLNHFITLRNNSPNPINTVYNSTTPLTLACAVESIPTVQLLLSHRNSINPNNLSQALIIACKKGNKRLVKLLLDSGADPNHIHDESSPLFAAIEGNFPHIKKLLLDAGANPNLTIDDETNWTILHQTARVSNSVQIMKLLLDTGKMEPNAQSQAGDMALHVVCCSVMYGTRKKEVVQGFINLLIEYGADVQIKNWDGMTAWDVLMEVMEVIEGDMGKVVEMLGEEGVRRLRGR
ncbi:ankyrin repeat-containing domain protein [Podospora fimiseda]|uniref:Ankyrin repeat-containing domain protein n=1 Tax=Podospora fimiseda TaxID=252190 RepID=A0AAN7H5C9_9PEZI|nr:ankyrin repeat-containing domain protein [Podospora fimiseda]